ncbi:Auxin efflux carrier [Artemisia annua]|uniref:Auxin efflux carrier n=1 Tax=Artemisia annua TaxID=35608 RepID=A0A2U1P7A8_ARTAN|nr:Auxin efflux carrier [Artemisia annua]
MYGSFGESIVIQSSILQFTIWNIILLMMYEFRSVKNSMGLKETPNESATDLEGNTNEDGPTKKPSLLILLKMVGLKIAKNPNSYACIFGLAWALYRMGLFIALQKKIIDCGAALTTLGMLLRFVVAPAAMAVSSLIVGLRGDVLCISIIQGHLWHIYLHARTDIILCCT